VAEPDGSRLLRDSMSGSAGPAAAGQQLAERFWPRVLPPAARAFARRLTCARCIGIGVLVTRPEQQAMPLCRLLEAQGAAPALPAVEIKPLGDGRAIGRAHSARSRISIIVFHQRQRRSIRRSCSIKARSDAGRHRPGDGARLEPSGLPRGRAAVRDSTPRRLLAHPGLEHVAGQRISDDQGRRWRDLLEQELTRRGAHGGMRRCLRRVPATPSARIPRRRWSDSRPGGCT
jgi:hypothetical protein